MDLSGQIIKDIKVLYRDEENLQKSKEQKGGVNPIYVCQCLLCGNIFKRNATSIKNNKYGNCGCQSLQYDLTNKRFGKLIALKCIGSKHKEKLWLCKCDCGNFHETTSYNLRIGKTTQCNNCMKKQIGLSNTKLINKDKRLKEIYVNMNTRCNNPNYKMYHAYGGKGITVCDEWSCKLGYNNFSKWALENGYKSNLTLDRIDNDKGYYPENCRWATMKQQQNNRTNNKILEFNGCKYTLMQFSELLPVGYGAVTYWLKKDLTPEQIYERYMTNKG